MKRDFASLASTPTRNFMIWSAALLFLVHGILWFKIAGTRGETFSELLNHWDASWYTSIISRGYTADNRAFPPLYPLLVDVVWKVTAERFAIPVAGTLVSTIIFFIFIFQISEPKNQKPNAQLALTPQSKLEWLIFLLSPASYVFHSHHTESLFLLLTFLAFLSCAQETHRRAGLFAGLAALTRVQGVFVAIACAVWAAAALYWRGRKTEAARWDAIKVFITVGIISGVLFLLYPGYLGVVFKDPMSYFHTNVGWDTKDLGIAAFFKSFWLGNAWQNHKFGSIVHHFFVMAITASLFIKKFRTPTFLAYVGLNLFVFPCQGEYIDSFRFCAVMFPVYFVLGQWLKDRAPVYAQWALLAGMLALNLAVATNYALLKWAY